MSNTKTLEQIKAEYRAKGMPIARVARENGWTPQEVYKVLNGQSKGHYGKAHDIAVFFGLKNSA